MKDQLTLIMDRIDDICRQQGYYPDLIELYNMAQAAITSNVPLRTVIAEYNA